MKRAFKRTGSVIRVRLSEYEASLLASLTEQLLELIEADPGEATDEEDAGDPFERWQAEFSEPASLDRTDPVITRLFPDAYPGDPAASAEFRRLTQARQRADRHAQSQVVLDALTAAVESGEPVQVGLADLDAWLKTLAAVRLSLASRLGITIADDAAELDVLPDDDPRGYVYRVYEWIAWLTENLLALVP